MTSKLKLLGASTAVAAFLMASAPAMATTTAGTDVLNTVNITYQVGGVTQTPPPAATNTFKVDRKVLYTLAEDGNAATGVTPGQTGAITRFVLTNNSNDALGFSLTAADLVGGTLHGNTDNINLDAIRLCVEAAVPNTCLAPAVTGSLAVNTLAKDGASIKILVLGDIPVAATNGQDAAIRLSSTATEVGGAAITYATDATVNSPTAVETIWGVPAAAVATFGKRSADDDYLVGAAILGVTKYSRIVSDGVTGVGGKPKAIPGAVVEYCIVVSNTGPAGATSVNVTDDLSAVGLNGGVSYDATFTPKAGGTSFTTDGDGVTTCAVGATNGSYAAPTVTGPIGAVPAGSVGTPTVRTFVFRATIN
jgi:uncharacterized repeat protein (TIGR01451 family)